MPADTSSPRRRPTLHLGGRRSCAVRGGAQDRRVDDHRLAAIRYSGGRRDQAAPFGPRTSPGHGSRSTRAVVVPGRTRIAAMIEESWRIGAESGTDPSPLPDHRGDRSHNRRTRRCVTGSGRATPPTDAPYRTQDHAPSGWDVAHHRETSHPLQSRCSPCEVLTRGARSRGGTVDWSRGGASHPSPVTQDVADPPGTSHRLQRASSPRRVRGAGVVATGAPATFPARSSAVLDRAVAGSELTRRHQSGDHPFTRSFSRRRAEPHPEHDEGPRSGERGPSCCSPDGI